MASLVIKVKYEETLRRLNVAINGDQKLDLSMEGLRLKIRSLFNLPTDASIRLTYKDEDGDLVTLGDDDDLNDIVRQGLNPVRISVHVSSDQSAQSSSTPSSGSAIPSTASSQNVQPKFNVDEALKSLQEPLNRVLLNLRSLTPNPQQNAIAADARKILKSVQAHLAQVLTKLQSDISSAPTSPILADLFDGLHKLRQLCLNAALSISGNFSGSSHNKDGNEVTKNDGIDTPVPIQPAPKSTQATGLNVSVEDKSASCESSAKKMSSSGSTKSRDVAFSGARVMPASQKESSFGSIIHKNVGCDGCGVLPITGPRFKSKVKYDYDLCSLCFSRMGNDLHYTRIDIPLPYIYTSSFNAADAMSPNRSMARPYVPKHLRMGFDSRFVMDVNVIDGTTMAPSTPFTKTWRMQNTGSVPWTRGLRCQWICGDRFSPSDSVEIQVPLTGVNVASEINISVDFIAPDLPGRYVSYWRMADPSGHQFGQRVWVHIQVDQSLDLTRERCPMLDLNLPPESNETALPHVANVKAEPESDVEVGDSSAPSILENNTVMLGPNFPINDDLLVAAGSSHVPPATGSDTPVSPVAPSPVSSPTPAASASEVSYPAIDGVSNVHEQVTEELSHHDEARMLKELEQMGFKQTDLNREVLRMNTYDLERSVDDLCDVSEWGPLLEELRQMGFEDKVTNKKLLVKNNGSITRVVMELIADE
ncbi:protein NBR1 homolog [Silene latifolia]|uniref:protein NBR1 homolog n=1 Tax=Silene latifolia TaxID=37657 RepID=UPI003D77FC20